MKTYVWIFLTLFSFASGIRYEVQQYRCEENILRVKYENNWYDLTLFNINIEEDVDICAYVDGEVSFEFEEAIMQNEQNEAYVFVDGNLLQKTLVEEGKASIKLNSHAYKYDMKKKEEAVIAEVEEEETVEKEMYSRKIAIVFFSAWILICIFIIRHKLRYQKDINTTENDV